MKKWLIGFACILVLSICCLYIFIPEKVTISLGMRVNCNAHGALPFVSDSSKWVQWWPSGNFTYKGVSYRPQGSFSYVTFVRIEGKDSALTSRMLLVPMANPDSSQLYWDCDLHTGLSPFARIGGYRYASAMRKDMGEILVHLRSFLEKKENIYGINIRPASTTDSFLVATRSVFPTAPGVLDIYSLVKRLREHIGAKGAKETGYPMLNTTKTADGRIQAMVAIPINRQLNDEGIFYSRRLVMGHYLETEVNGGMASVEHALGHLQAYVEDYHKTIMAIPFQSMVTDRDHEPDTAKWVTRIYYPVY